jgi:hypothetical protein
MHLPHKPTSMKGTRWWFEAALSMRPEYIIFYYTELY